MYTIENISEAVKEIQRLLGLSQTGDFNSVTENAVRAHQAKVEINESGIVDYETFLSLIEEAKMKEKEKNSSVYLPSAPYFPYKFGDNGRNVSLINTLIAEISEDYFLASRLPRGDFYGKDTENSIKELQVIFLLEETGEVDAVLLSRMIDEKNAIKMRKATEK